MDDFNFNELFEEDNEIETMKKEAQMEEAMYELKMKLANENYNMIIENGIDIKMMKNNGLDIKALNITLNQMLEIFVEVEEYEKCSKIKEILERI
jgi:hypothetical protein